MRNFNLMRDFLTNFSYVGYCTLLGSVKEVIQSVLNYGDYNINLN